MPAPHTEEQTRQDSEALLDAAEALFYEKGIRAVGMDEVRAASGLPLKRIYRLHPAKDDLVVAVLRRRDLRWRAALAAAVETTAAATPAPGCSPRSTGWATGSPSPATGAAPGSTPSANSARPPRPSSPRCAPTRQPSTPNSPTGPAQRASPTRPPSNSSPRAPS